MVLLNHFVLLVALWMLIHTSPASGDSNGTTIVQGAGSSLSTSLYLDASFSFHFVESSVQVTFSNINANQTLCGLMNHSENCAVNDTVRPLSLDWGSLVSPPPPSTYQQCPDLQLYPTVASAVVPIYNLNGVTDLVLGLPTLAKIWSGHITTWDHPDIKATNPNFTSWNITANQSIALVARGDTTGVTEVFKKAMADVDAVFRSQVGTSAAPTWNGTPVVWENSPEMVVAFVMQNHYSMSYAPMGDAVSYRMPMAKLNRSGLIVEASITSVQYALLEKGLSFGNNGDESTHLTGDVFGAVNPLAWPITTYSYLVVRKSSLRPGATCATVSALVSFWLWFWSSSEVESLVSSHGFGVLPVVVRDYVMARFQQDMRCGGSLVWQETEVPMIQGYGPGSAILIFNKFQQAYTMVNSSVELSFSALTGDQDVDPLLQAGGFVVSSTPLSSPSDDVFSFVLASELLAAVSQFTLTLDCFTVARILNGDIQTWLHPDILALNPNGIRDSSGRVLNDTAQRIVLVQGPTVGSAPVTALLQRYYPAYTGAAVLAVKRIPDPVVAWAVAMGTPYSFALAALVGQLPEELHFASIVVNGVSMAPSLATAKVCAANASYNHNVNSVNLALDNRSCYPLQLPVYVSVQRQCPTVSRATARTITFLEWMFSDATLEAALDSLNLVSLNEASSAIQANNAEALFQLSCGVRPPAAADVVPLLLACIVPIVAVVLVGLAFCGWWLWRITKFNRELRRKFSNDNVAESCAEAIARFDLAAVAWLQEVKEPNKIQLAFLAIIALLTEVKPFIPDQLLSRLTSGKANACPLEEDNEAEQRSGTSSPLAQRSPHPLSHVRCDSYPPDRQLLESPLTSHSSLPPSPSSVRRVRQVNPASIPSSDGVRQVLSVKDWHRTRCTYMCIRFGSTHPNSDRRLQGLVQAAGRIVDVGKAHGATIDAVGVDFVNVHWGVTSMQGASSARAVQTGLEMEQVRDVLPEDQQAAFWLQIGIGKGLCDCGTVSSESGHRFFVVWGPEALLAVKVAMADLPKRVLTSVLVSPAVYQEVQFTVQCMPRLWHGDVLLWEPLCVLKKEEDDEWMYELKRMNEGTSLSNKTLLDVFLLAKDKTMPATCLSHRIAELKLLYGDGMSEQDKTALDLLLAMADGSPDIHDIVFTCNANP